MQSRHLVPCLVAVCGLGAVALARACDDAATASLSDEARVALEIGCRGHDGREARECRSTLKRLYLAGSLDPDKTLRAYCDAVENGRWGGSRPAPPALCVRRYGGWRQG